MAFLPSSYLNLNKFLHNAYAVILFLFFFLMQPVYAASPLPQPDDILTLKNGDTLKGHLEKVEGGFLYFHSGGAGKLKVAWKYVLSLHVPESFAVLEKGIHIRQGRLNPRVPEGPFEVKGQILTVSSASGPINVSIEKITHIVDTQTYEKTVYGNPRLWQGWTGSVSGGASFVQSTQSLETFNSSIALVRSIPMVPWLEPDNRSILGFTSTYGSISQPNTPTISTSIYHGNAEQDEYFSRDFYALAQALYDHNSTAGLNLQQIYGAGIGFTALRRPSQELNFTLTTSYTNQQFQVSSANQSLVGATFTTTYFYRFPNKIIFNENSYITPEFNNSRAYLAYLSAGLTIPVIFSLAFSIQAIDNYWNEPAPGFVNNSFQLNAGLSFTIPSY